MKSVNKVMNQLIENSKKDDYETKSITIRLGFQEYGLLAALADEINKKPSALAKIIFHAALEDAKESYLNVCENEGEESEFLNMISFQVNLLNEPEEKKRRPNLRRTHMIAGQSKT